MGHQHLEDTVIIFDLDGTLVDSARDLSRSLNHVLKNEGLPPVPPELTGLLVGHGANAMMAAGFDVAGQPYPPPNSPERERLFDSFIAHYRDHIADHTIVFPGVEAALKELRSAGATLAVCTNKQTDLAVLLIDQLDLSGYFAEILGRDAAARYKPAPDPLLEIRRRTDKPSGIMIGDSHTDRDAARAAQMPCYLVTHGYGKLDEPLTASEALFSHFDDLPRLILNEAAATVPKG